MAYLAVLAPGACKSGGEASIDLPLVTSSTRVFEFVILVISLVAGGCSNAADKAPEAAERPNDPDETPEATERPNEITFSHDQAPHNEFAAVGAVMVGDQQAHCQSG